MSRVLPEGWTVERSPRGGRGYDQHLVDPSGRIVGYYGMVVSHRSGGPAPYWACSGSYSMPSEQACIDYLVSRAEQ